MKAKFYARKCLLMKKVAVVVSSKKSERFLASTLPPTWNLETASASLNRGFSTYSEKLIMPPGPACQVLVPETLQAMSSCPSPEK